MFRAHRSAPLRCQSCASSILRVVVEDGRLSGQLHSCLLSRIKKARRSVLSIARWGRSVIIHAFFGIQARYYKLYVLAPVRFQSNDNDVHKKGRKHTSFCLSSRTMIQLLQADVSFYITLLLSMILANLSTTVNVSALSSPEKCAENDSAIVSPSVRVAYSEMDNASTPWTRS